MITVKPRIEAEQVPIKGEFEAAKDHEQRLAKVLSWLWDNEHIETADFNQDGSISWYQPPKRGYTRTEPREIFASPGEWIVIEQHGRPEIYSDYDFKRMFVEDK